jgi:hypothetical protein
MRSIHTVTITPDWSQNVGTRFDPAAFIENCKRVGVTDIEFYTKAATGDAFFPYGNRQVAGGRDWTTDTRRLAKEHGIAFSVYYNVGIDGRMAKEHPEWTCRTNTGEILAYAGGQYPVWTWMCIQSPWRQRVLDEVRQVAEAVRPDGFWFDLLGGPNSYSHGELDVAKACHCDYCNAAYRKRTGHMMPAESNDIQVRRTVFEIAQKARVSLIRDLEKVIHSVDPAIVIGYNHAGDFWDKMGVAKEDADFRDGIGLYALEAKPHSHQSMRAKLLWSTGHAFEIMTFGNFQKLLPGAASGSWIDWNLIPPAYQQISGAIVSAHSGRYIIGVDPLPSGEVLPGEFDNLAANFASIARREPWLNDLASVPNIAIVYDVNSEYARRLQPPGKSVRVESEGLHDALQDTNAHFDVVHGEYLNTIGHRALLCGDMVCPPADLSEKVRSFVRGGGLLIATNETSLWGADGRRQADFGWADLFGVKFAGFSPYQTANYLQLGDELRGDAPKYPALITDNVLHITPTTARPLADLVYPEAERTVEVNLWPGSPHNSFGAASGRPLVTVNSYGDGKVIYIAAPIGTQIANRLDVWLKYLIAQAVKRFAQPLAITLEAPPGIAVVFGRKRRPDAGRPVHVVSLINRYGGMILRPGEASHPPIGPINVRIPLAELGGPPQRVESIDANGVEWKAADGMLNISILRIGHHAVLRI